MAQSPRESRRIPAIAASVSKLRVFLVVAFALILLVGFLGRNSLKSKKIPVENKDTINGTHWTSFDNIEAVFSFGDSWTSHGHKVCPDYNDTDAYNPARVGYPGFTFSNGPNWMGFLTHVFNRSAIHLYDLAVAGTTVDYNAVRGLGGWDLKHGVSHLFGPEQGGGNMTHCQYMPSNIDPNTSLLSVFFGMNDILGCWDGNNHCNIFQPPINQIFQSYSQSLTELYDGGARNFLLLNAPPTDPLAALDLPSNDDETKARTKASKLFNEVHHRLAEHVRRFPGATVFEVDVYGLMLKVYEDPKSVPYTADYRDLTGSCEHYGPQIFQEGIEVTKAMVDDCGGLKPDDYLWNGAAHTTWPFHKAIASLAVEVMDQYGKGNSTQ